MIEGKKLREAFARLLPCRCTAEKRCDNCEVLYKYVADAAIEKMLGEDRNITYQVEYHEKTGRMPIRPEQQQQQKPATTSSATSAPRPSKQQQQKQQQQADVIKGLTRQEYNRLYWLKQKKRRHMVEAGKKHPMTPIGGPGKIRNAQMAFLGVRDRGGHHYTRKELEPLCRSRGWDYDELWNYCRDQLEAEHAKSFVLDAQQKNRMIPQPVPPQQPPQQPIEPSVNPAADTTTTKEGAPQSQGQSQPQQ